MSESFTVKSVRGEYKVHSGIEALSDLPARLRQGDVIVADRTVTDLYPELSATFADQNHTILLDVNERLKSYQGIEPVIEKLIKSGFRKNNNLIAIGGGITQDVTAFIASILFRGVNWYFYPTTLLAQCDSCIGSKTSINFAAYKNQLGGFYPPAGIYIDFDFLKTLPDRDIRSGLGEMAHYYLVSGPDDYRRFKSECRQALEERRILPDMILHSLQIKKKYIEVDEYDTGPRNVFNYGHTFGHAIESLTDYEVPHGIAVSFGMDIANYISARKNLIDDSLREEIRETLQGIWSGTTISHIDVDRYRDALLKDKKALSGQLYCILTRGAGEMFKSPLELNSDTLGWIRHCLDGYC